MPPFSVLLQLGRPARHSAAPDSWLSTAVQDFAVDINAFSGADSLNFLFLAALVEKGAKFSDSGVFVLTPKARLVLTRDVRRSISSGP